MATQAVNSQLKKRMVKEMKNAEKDGDDTIWIQLNGDDSLQQFSGFVIGPDDTPYAGGTYEIAVSLPTDYPFEPPKMWFKTKIWHPNVSSNTGAICMDVLAVNWLPVMTVLSTLRSIQSLLGSPQPDDPIDAEVATMLKSNRDSFWIQARRWAIKEANSPTDIAEETHRKIWLRKMATILPADEPVGVDLYKSYNRTFVDDLVVMGFPASQVVHALEDLRVPPEHTANGEHQKHNLMYAVTDWILENRD